MTTTITFAIPTWNRVEEFDPGLKTLCEQCAASDGRADIFISNHGSDDGTTERIAQYQQQYPFIKTTLLERAIQNDFSHNFREIFRYHPTPLPEDHYTWTFGDDDLLMPGALQAVLKVLDENPELDFLHCAEIKRTENSNKLYKGTLLELCDSLGFIDMTGFISCNIVRTSLLNACAELPSWDLYAQSAFPQSLSLFEVCRDKPFAFLDSGLVDSGEQSPRCQAQWTFSNIGGRYFLIAPALINMRERAIMPLHVTPAFFRYLSYHLWDRFIDNCYSSYTSTEDFKITEPLLDCFNHTLTITSFLREPHLTRFSSEIKAARELAVQHSHALAYAVNLANQLSTLAERHNSTSHFPYNYVK